MEQEIKNKTDQHDLLIAPSADGQASSTLINKYEHFIRNDLNIDNDSDNEFMPDECMLKDDFAKLRKSLTSNESSRQLTNLLNKNRNETYFVDESPVQQQGIDRLNELIEKLSQIRKCGPNGNSIFCNADDHKNIERQYGELLDFVYETCTKLNQPKPPPTCIETEALDAKIASVEETRNKLSSVMNQVNELLEQLELVERYKMESVS